jgi:Icc-related predicted phosphoesterase
MKILVIGDPHGDVSKLRKIPKKGINLILVTGDLGQVTLARKRYFENVERKKRGLEEIEENAKYSKDVYMEVHNSTMNVLKYLSKFAPVYTITGNVAVFTDAEAKKRGKKWNIKFPSTVREIKKLKNVHIIKNRLRVIKGVRIGFLEFFVDTNWVQDFKPSDYKKRMREAKKETEKAKRILRRFNDLDIFICHQPPYGYLDKVDNPAAPKHWQGNHAGSKAILEFVKKKQPPYVFSAHMHEGEGKTKIGKSEVYNLGVCGYKILNLQNP